MNQHDRDESRPESFTRGLGKAMTQEARSWLRWNLRGAGVGAIGGVLCAFFLYGNAATGF
jgi:hypothetical protein